MLFECVTEVRRLEHIMAAGSVKTRLYSSHTHWDARMWFRSVNNRQSETPFWKTCPPPVVLSCHTLPALSGIYRVLAQYRKKSGPEGFRNIEEISAALPCLEVK